MTHPACEKPRPGETAPRYDSYLARCDTQDVRQLLRRQRLELLEELSAVDDEAGSRAYAPVKWSAAQLVGHLADTEQVFLERALRAARGDAGRQPGFSEDDFAAAWTPRLAAALNRWLDQRTLALNFFTELPEDAWLRPGMVEDRPYTVRALAWLTACHFDHHLQVLRERYRPLWPEVPPRVLDVTLGPELRLRHVELGDQDELVALCQAERERLGRWLGWAEQAIDPEVTGEFLFRSREVWLRRGLPSLLILASGQMAGGIGLNPLEGKSAHIGYWVSASVEGRGLVRRAVRWLTAHSFEALGLDRVEIRCAVENQRSRAVPESLGFRLEGVMRGAQRLLRGPQDLAVYALCAADWPVLRDAWESADPAAVAIDQQHSIAWTTPSA